MVCPRGGAGVELGLAGAKHVGIPTAWTPSPPTALAPWATLSGSLHHSAPQFPHLSPGVLWGWQ